MAATQKGERSDAAHVPTVRAWRLAVIGAAMGTRLQRPALLRRLGQPVLLLGPFDDAAQAAAALRTSDLDALLIHEPHLHAGCPHPAFISAFIAETQRRGGGTKRAACQDLDYRGAASSASS